MHDRILFEHPSVSERHTQPEERSQNSWQKWLGPEAMNPSHRCSFLKHWEHPLSDVAWETLHFSGSQNPAWAQQLHKEQWWCPLSFLLCSSPWDSQTSRKGILRDLAIVLNIEYLSQHTKVTVINRKKGLIAPRRRLSCLCNVHKKK